MIVENPAHDIGQRGISLVELIAFIVIVGVALGGIAWALNFNAQHTVDPVIRKQALAVAEAMLEEVEMMPFTYCDPTDALVSTATSAASCSLAEGMGPEPGESRGVGVTSVFNNVNDYNGFAVSPFTLLSMATAVPNLGVYSATVQVSAVNLGSITQASGDALLIRVQAGTQLTSVTLEGYRTRYNPNLLMR
ncbi:MAG: type II secretion system protein [Nitrosomonadales bacterium]|nr:MAG: type II secretion system protein [Nitrosomonadales bacterium]